MHRSTSRASKHRRELIKAEIDRFRELLPLPNAVKARLSFLHVMSLGCVYVRKGHYFNQDQDLVPPVPSWNDTTPFDFTQALHGFLLVMTRQGKLLYISENVTDYLGHSMVELLSTGGDLYEVIDPRDHAVVRGQMAIGSNCGGVESEYPTEDERTFFCRMNTSRNMRRKDHCTDNKMVRIKGRFRILWSGCCYNWNQVEPVFAAVCSPVETLTPIADEMVPLKTSMFTTEHGMDMVVYNASSNVFFHLGYEVNELCGKSWYSIVHPDCLETARKYHQQMLQPSIGTAASRCAFVLRLLRKDTGCVTVSVTAWLDRDATVNHAAVIMCQNLVIREDEITMYESQALHESLARRSASCLVSPSPASVSGSSERFSCGPGDEMASPWPESYPRGDGAPPCPTDASPVYAYESFGGQQTQRPPHMYQADSIPYQYLDDRGGGSGSEWCYNTNCYYQGTAFNDSAYHMNVVDTGWNVQVQRDMHHDRDSAGSEIHQGNYGPYSTLLVGPARAVQSLRSGACSRKECLVEGSYDVGMLTSNHSGSKVDPTGLANDSCPALKKAVLEWARRLRARRQLVSTLKNREPCFSTSTATKVRKRSHEDSELASPGPNKAEMDFIPCGSYFACTGSPTKRRLEIAGTTTTPRVSDTGTHVSPPLKSPVEMAAGNQKFINSWIGSSHVLWTDTGVGKAHEISVPDSILTPESSPTHDDSSPAKPRRASAASTVHSPGTIRPECATQRDKQLVSNGENEPIGGTLEAAVGKALCALSSDELRLLDQATLSLLHQNASSRSSSIAKRAMTNSDNE